MQLTQAQLNRYRKLENSARSNAVKYLRIRLEREAKGLPIAGIRDKTIELIVDGLGIYGDQAQAYAGELFEEICRAEGLEVKAELFDELIDHQMMADKVRYNVKHILNNDWDNYKRANTDLIDYYVHRCAYENLARNCDKNNIRYACVPSGHETCAFCFMLSSRGFVYHSEMTAQGTHGVHRHCDCMIVPGPYGRVKVGGYDPKGMFERYAKCAQSLGLDVSSPKNQRAIHKEVAKRDWRWLYTGKTPKLEYADDSVRLKKEANKTERAQHELEKRTAGKLRAIGFRTVFVNDEITGKDGKIIGIADLQNGIEIKTVYQASSINTINRHISSCKKKRRVDKVIIDVSENENLTDELAETYIASCLASHNMKEAFLLRHDNSLVRIVQKRK